MVRHTCLLLTLVITSAAAPIGPIPLWPDAAPDDIGSAEKERDTTTAKDGLVAGKRIIRLGNVNSPTFTVYQPAAAKSNNSAVLVFPGGGYSILAMDLEGTEICEWLNSIGITAVLVKYRVPNANGLPRHLRPLQDAQRAMGVVRQRAPEWGIDRNRIGVIGFSAGGHLAAVLSNSYQKRSYPVVDTADSQSGRPDFVMLIYPAYLTVKDENDKLAPELSVSNNTPPTFLVQAEDDAVRVESSLFYYLALKNAKVPAEMHLFASGGHGYGLRVSTNGVTRWPRQAEDWLQSLGIKVH